MGSRRRAFAAALGLLVVSAVTGCSDSAATCDPQAFLDQEQTDQDVLAPEHVEVIENVDPASTRLLADLSDPELNAYIGSSVEGDVCLILVTTDALAGCGPSAAGSQVTDSVYTLGLLTEGIEDPPSAALTQAVPDSCLAVRY